MIEWSYAISYSHIHCIWPHCDDIHHADHDHLSLLSTIQPLLANQPGPRKSLPSGSLETDPLDHVRRERLDRYLPVRDTATDAVAIKLEDLQKARCNPGAEWRYTHRGLRNLEECLCSDCKFDSIAQTNVLRAARI